MKLKREQTSVYFRFQDQFEFALTAVAEEVNAILKALPQWNQYDPDQPPDWPPPFRLLSYLTISLCDDDDDYHDEEWRCASLSACRVTP